MGMSARMSCREDVKADLSDVHEGLLSVGHCTSHKLLPLLSKVDW